MTFLDFFLSYWLPAIEFTAEIALIALAFFFGAKHRSRFGLRVGACVGSFIPISFGAGWLLFLLGSYALGKALTFFLLFSYFVASSIFLFDEDKKKIVFYAGIAYAVQNLIYKLFVFLWVGAEFFNWLSALDIDSYWSLYRALSYVFYLLMALLAWKVLLKKAHERLKTGRLDGRMFIITSLILFSTIVLCSIDDAYFARLSTGTTMRFGSVELFVLRENSNAFSILAGAATLYLASKSVLSHELKQEVEYLKHAIRQGEKQYEISKDTIEMINVKCHDIKYKLGALAAENNLSKDAVKELSDSVRIYDSRLQTGNQLLNVLLWEKSLYCEQNGIVFTAMVDGESLDFMEAGDLYCLFGNMVDNALEAVKGIAEKQRRVINLTAKRKGDLILIQEDNYFDGELTFVDGLPTTTKEDRSSHGFGTRSLRMIVRKYGGELTCYVESGVFHLNIILSSQDR
ncbi:MAG: GHKL domain-containing protein [Bacilli bacterium]|nr:GHKL domain-containing protein [Bacilli bacterium]